jgi:uncharacterized protein (TIGR00369 family)
MSFHENLEQVRSVEDLQPLIDRIPYARSLGFSLMRDGTDVIGRMAYAEHLIGNPTIGALHGGTLGALLEFTAVCKLLTMSETARVPKTVNITVEYLRSAGCKDTFARATVTRHGRRVANVRVVAYQDDPQRPVAAATAHFLMAG